jgi:hypothetical protein
MATATITELHLLVTYKCSLKVVDDACIHASDQVKATVRQMMHQQCANHQPIAPHGLSLSSATTSTVVNTPFTHTLDCLPPLTAEKRALLVENEGCFKCCHFYTNHKSTDFPDSFPDKLSYAPLTEVQALVTKENQLKRRKHLLQLW